MQVNFHHSINDIAEADWNALTGDDYPFLKHQFLAALEQSGSVTAETGWTPQHISITQGTDYLAIMPLYAKNHSYGEYVFDWAWADAYHRHGIPYYPKLLTAIPFTPASGPRLLMADHAQSEELLPLLIESLQHHAKTLDCSSWHLLFPKPALFKQLTDGISTSDSLLARKGCQYHWFNQGYNDFDQFLAGMTSRKRKSIKRERRRAVEQGVELRVVEGSDIDDDTLAQFFRFYQLTYANAANQAICRLSSFNKWSPLWPSTSC